MTIGVAVYFYALIVLGVCVLYIATGQNSTASKTICKGAFIGAAWPLVAVVMIMVGCYEFFRDLAGRERR